MRVFSGRFCVGVAAASVALYDVVYVVDENVGRLMTERGDILNGALVPILEIDGEIALAGQNLLLDLVSHRLVDVEVLKLDEVRIEHLAEIDAEASAVAAKSAEEGL